MNALLLAVTLASGLAADDKDTMRYDDHGIVFNYPKDWKVEIDKKKDVTVTVAKDKGTQVRIQIFGAEVEPKAELDQMDKTYRKSFEGKLVKGSDKAVKRKLAGEEREGLTLAFEIMKDVTFNVEVFAFAAPSKKKTLAVIFHTSSLDAEMAKKGFAVIADSFQEAKPK